MKLSTILILGGIGVASLALILYVKKNGLPTAAGVGAAAGAAVVDGASGVVLGVGDAVGVPRTDMTECERAKAEGRTWDASFACPAKDFLSYVFH